MKIDDFVTVIPNASDINFNQYLVPLVKSLRWECHDLKRLEVFFNRKGTDYLFTRGRGVRPYYEQNEPEILSNIWAHVEGRARTKYEACFINWYLDAKSNIGWHSDNSPSIDPQRSVSVLTIGAEREVWFREKDYPSNVYVVSPKSGEIVIMHPGCNDLIEHSVPGTDGDVGPRLSLVFRGLK